MKTKLIWHWLVLATLGLSASWAQAVTCQVTSSGVATSYTGLAVAAAGTATVTCTRSATDANPMTINYRLAVNDGANSSVAPTNRARVGTTSNYLNYDTWQTAACGTIWGPAQGDRVPVGMTLNGTTPSTLIVNYTLCIPASQTFVPNTYVDTPVTMTVYDGPGNSGNAMAPAGTFQVSINTAASCSITTIPNIALAYTAFSAAAVNANTTFGVTCSSGLAYSMALDRVNEVAVGVQYSLALSTLSTPGTGVQQNYTVTATAAAGQAGTCASASCTGTQPAGPHTVTVTY
jgi:spore coat protein U-like protein